MHMLHRRLDKTKCGNVDQNTTTETGGVSS